MYYQKTYEYGNRIEIRKYYSWRCKNSGESRVRTGKPTPEKMKALNEKNAIRRLERLMIGNFTENDWHIVLTYSNEDRPDAAGGKKCLQGFLRRMRKEYEKRGEELRYITATEYQSTNIHHHIVLNGINGLNKIIQKCWKGGKHFTPLYPDRDFQGLAKYFVKETSKTYDSDTAVFKTRYTCSKNLKKPVEHKKIVPADSWRKEPKVPEKLAAIGYVLDKDSIETGVNDLGYGYQEYILIRYERSRN